MAEISNNPTAEGTNAWTNPSYGRTSNDSYATAAPAASSSILGIWTTFGITDPGGATITKVEVGTEHKVSTTASKATLGREISWDGGSSWSTQSVLSELETEVTSDTVYWLDVTSVTAWTFTKLNDTNLRTRIAAIRGSGATGYTMSLDAIWVRVTYSVITSTTVTKTSDTRFFKATTTTLTADSRFFKTTSLTLAAATTFKLTTTLTKAADTVFRLVTTLTKLSDSRFFKTTTLTKTSDAQFGDVSVISYTIEKTSDSRFFKAMTKTVLSDARFRKAFTLQITSDSRFRTSYILQSLSNAVFKGSAVLTKLSNAAFRTAFIITKQSNAQFYGPVVKTLTSNAVFWDGTTPPAVAESRGAWEYYYG